MKIICICGSTRFKDYILEAAKKEKPVLVLLDIMMPEMDGTQVCEILRKDASTASTPIVMVTSRGEKIDRVRGFDAGVDEYITKPHDRQELLRAVAKHLARKAGATADAGGEDDA